MGFHGHGRLGDLALHLDHIAALPLYLARRRMMKMEPPTIYLPAGAEAAVEAMLRAFQRLTAVGYPVNSFRSNRASRLNCPENW